MMEPFKKDSACVKCLGKKIKVQHKDLLSSIEHIRCECETCGYYWQMETADAQDKKKEDLIMEKK